jgi:hypothetical protein
MAFITGSPDHLEVTMASLPLAPASLVVLLTLAQAGCSNPTDTGHMRVVGTIDPTSSSVPALVVPTEARARVAFTVLVHTRGSSDCTQPDGESLEIQGDLARVVPYDVVPSPGHAYFCLRDFGKHRHQLSITFPRSGTARVRLVGMHPTRPGILDSVEGVVTVGP